MDILCALDLFSVAGMDQLSEQSSLRAEPSSDDVSGVGGGAGLGVSGSTPLSNGIDHESVEEEDPVVSDAQVCPVTDRTACSVD